MCDAPLPPTLPPSLPGIGLLPLGCWLGDRIDLWALGITAYYLIFSTTPFEGPRGDATLFKRATPQNIVHKKLHFPDHQVESNVTFSVVELVHPISHQSGENTHLHYT